MVLYKYLKSEYARNLINGGIVRLGTLYEFRQGEVYGEAIGDRDEGKTSARLFAANETWTSEQLMSNSSTPSNIKRATSG